MDKLPMTIHSGLGAELGTWGIECFTDLSIRHEALTAQARPVGPITPEE